MTDIVVFGAIAAVVLAAGIGLGMLVAPRLTRLTESDDEPADEESDDEPNDEGSGDERA